MKAFSFLAEQDMFREVDDSITLNTANGDTPNATVQQHCGQKSKRGMLPQMPTLIKGLANSLNSYSKLVQNDLVSNDENEKAFFNIAATSIETLKQELREPGLSPEDRGLVMDRIVTICQQASDKVLESQKHVQREHIILGSLILLSVGAIAASLGINKDWDMFLNSY